MKRDPLTLSVIGCGLIGRSWTALFLANGHDVRAWDPDADVRASLPSQLTLPREQLLSLGKGQRPGRLMVADTLGEAVAGADFIQENAPENVPVKHALYAQIEVFCPAEAILSSSTSAFTWSDLSVGMRHPARFITAHPFNPPHLIPLIELFGIDADVLDRAENFYRGLGSSPVRLKKDAVGHIANRLASALWREAVNIVAEGIADVSDVDRALVDGPGLRWSVVGAHMCYHLGGGEGGIAHYLQQLGPSQERRWKTLGDPRLTPEVCERLVAGIAAEADGRTIPELEADRDARLIDALKARSAHV
ncbi:3-hydroxyacyl-CoA dehydrogenase NAD-binding domain-containing protein [Ancylobacter sp.]|uniref:3-hydroxyacyl-CoA dehydrogenase NAD-binding domain-containing protein n=1 Tax=Ancylobacter sp. TaxID=1872567 RepID=UPI003C7CD0D7